MSHNFDQLNPHLEMNEILYRGNIKILFFFYFLLMNKRVIVEHT